MISPTTELPPTATPVTLSGIDAALRAAWSADTCSPDDLERTPWSAENPAWGHCDITALLVHDLFGGVLLCGDVRSSAGEQQGHHWWNRLPSGLELDLTREQFILGQQISTPRTVIRPPGPLRRQAEYELLWRRFGAAAGLVLSDDGEAGEATSASDSHSADERP